MTGRRVNRRKLSSVTQSRRAKLERDENPEYKLPHKADDVDNLVTSTKACVQLQTIAALSCECARFRDIICFRCSKRCVLTFQNKRALPTHIYAHFVRLWDEMNKVDDPRAVKALMSDSARL